MRWVCADCLFVRSLSRAPYGAQQHAPEGRPTRTVTWDPVAGSGRAPIPGNISGRSRPRLNTQSSRSWFAKRPGAGKAVARTRGEAPNWRRAPCHRLHASASARGWCNKPAEVKRRSAGMELFHVGKFGIFGSRTPRGLRGSLTPQKVGKRRKVQTVQIVTTRCGN